MHQEQFPKRQGRTLQRVTSIKYMSTAVQQAPTKRYLRKTRTDGNVRRYLPNSARLGVTSVPEAKHPKYQKKEKEKAQ